MFGKKILSPKIQTYNIKGVVEIVLNLTNIKLKDTLGVVKNEQISVLGYGS